MQTKKALVTRSACLLEQLLLENFYDYFFSSIWLSYNTITPHIFTHEMNSNLQDFLLNERVKFTIYGALLFNYHNQLFYWNLLNPVRIPWNLWNPKVFWKFCKSLEISYIILQSPEVPRHFSKSWEIHRNLLKSFKIL